MCIRDSSAVALQPNHFFPSGGPSQDRIRDAAALAKMYGLGMELEMDDRVDVYKRQVQDAHH